MGAPMGSVQSRAWPSRQCHHQPALFRPQGSRLVGTYDSVVAFGQSRALLVWQRIIMPDGSSIQIDNLPATDSAGYSGLEDQVDFHTWALIKGVAISTLLGVGSQLAISGQSDLMLSIRNSTQDSVNQAGQQPSLKIRDGRKFVCRPHGAAEIRNTAHTAQINQLIPFRQPAAPRVQPGGQIIQVVGRQHCHGLSFLSWLI